MPTRGSIGIGAEGRGQDGIGGLQANRHCLQVGILGRRDFNGCICWPTHCCHSLALLAFSLHVVHPFFGLGILAHGQDACKANRFSLPVLKIIQVVGGRVPSAPIATSAAPPAPYLANSLSFALLQISQHLDVGDAAQLVLDGFQAGHLVTTTHGDVCVQVGKGVLV